MGIKEKRVPHFASEAAGFDCTTLYCLCNPRKNLCNKYTPRFKFTLKFLQSSLPLQIILYISFLLQPGRDVIIYQYSYIHFANQLYY